jgi:positive regulator of sigma E activity
MGVKSFKNDRWNFYTELLNTVSFILFFAAFFNGFSKHSFVYWLYIVLLIPSIVIAATDINVSDHLKTIFHLIWAICLGFSAVYMYRRKVSLAQINDILLAIGLPIVSTTI